MKLLEVLARVDELLPYNQFSPRQKYNWCDDLGAQIWQEVKKEYGYYELDHEDRLGTLLPEHISFEMIDSIRTPERGLWSVFHRHIPRGRTIDKVDFRTYNIWQNNRMQLPPGSVVVYLMQHQHVRNIEFQGSVEYSPEGFVTSFPPFIAGDIITITMNGTTYEDVNVITVSEHEEEERFDRWFVELDWDVTNSGTVNIVAERLVTESTECPAPYDVMYVHYVLAQMAFFQKNYDEYNAQTALFNDLWDRYDKWYQERAPVNKSSSAKIRNFW